MSKLRSEVDTCSEAELDAFERHMGIKLPQSYRAHLVKFGWGGAWTEKNPVSHYSDWCDPNEPEEMPADFLVTPFPHVAPWNEQGVGPCWSVQVWTGAMRIINMGCELYYLLVVSGPERGAIWHDARQNGDGIYPLQHGDGRRVSFDDLVKNGRWRRRWRRFDPNLR